MYVFDTSALSELFGSYYRSRFPTLWKLFDELVETSSVTSTREVAREIEQYSRGGLNADPFVIAKAAVTDAIVVTLETEKPKAVRIPNICKHFGIECFNLEDFMGKEDWQF